MNKIYTPKDVNLVKIKSKLAYLLVPGSKGDTAS